MHGPLQASLVLASLPLGPDGFLGHLAPLLLLLLTLFLPLIRVGLPPNDHCLDLLFAQLLVQGNGFVQGLQSLLGSRGCGNVSDQLNQRQKGRTSGRQGPRRRAD